MSIFSDLKDLFTPSEDAPSSTPSKFPLPLGLTNSEFEDLQLLMTHPGWKVYLKSLDALTKFQGERILQSSKIEAIHFSRGFVSGLRRAATFTNEIVARKAEFERARNAESPGRDRSVLFGTPGWRPQPTERSRSGS